MEVWPIGRSAVCAENLWVPSVDLALSRIRERVSRGGHDVPEAVVRRRFDRSVRNFLIQYRSLADSWILYDNSAATPKIVASERLVAR